MCRMPGVGEQRLVDNRDLEVWRVQAAQFGLGHAGQVRVIQQVFEHHSDKIDHLRVRAWQSAAIKAGEQSLALVGQLCQHGIDNMSVVLRSS